MSYSTKLEEAVEKFKAAKKDNLEELISFWEEHARFYAQIADSLKEKVTKKSRAIELYDSMWRDACDYAEIDDVGECWPDEFKELEDLGEMEKDE